MQKQREAGKKTETREGVASDGKQEHMWSRRGEGQLKRGLVTRSRASLTEKAGGRGGLAEPCQYLLGIFEVLLPWAGIPEIPKVLLEPDLQVERLDLVPGGVEHLDRQAGVHPATQKHSNPEPTPAGLAAGDDNGKSVCWEAERRKTGGPRPGAYRLREIEDGRREGAVQRDGDRWSGRPLKGRG